MVNATETVSCWHAWRRKADESAFEALIHGETRYAADLARRMGASEAEAEDAVQEALLKLARERSDTPVEVGIRAWLCRRVVLGFKMHVRSAVRRRKYERGAPPPPPRADPTQRIEVFDQVQGALDRLGGTERQAVILRYLHDLDYREMAYVLGISENACRLRVHRGIKSLRATLGEKAAALVGILPLPAFGVESILTAAAVKSATATAAVLGTKAIATTGAGLLAAAAVVTAVAVSRPDPVPDLPPAIVAAAPEAPIAPPAPAPEPPPPPPPPPARVVPPALALLDAHLEGRRDVSDAMWRFGAVAGLIGLPDAARSVTVAATHPVSTPVNLEALARAADRVVLGPGTFHVTHPLRAEDRGEFEIAGAGPGKTFLTSFTAWAVTAKSDLAGLVVRDLTFDAEDPANRYAGGLLDVRGRAAAVFESVVFRTWSYRGGYGAPVGVTGRALLAFRDCTFLGGYRRRPDGAALALRGDAVYLFEGCLFADLRQVVSSRTSRIPHARSLGHFRDCTFDNARVIQEARWTEDVVHYPVRVRGGRIYAGWMHAPRERRLERWNRERLSEFVGTGLEGARTGCSLADLGRVLETYEPPEGRRVVGVEVLTWPGCDDPRYVVHEQDEAGALHPTLTRLGEDGAAPTSSEGWWVPARLPFHPGTSDTLEALFGRRVRWFDDPPAVGGAALHGDTGGKALLTVFDRFRDRIWGP